MWIHFALFAALLVIIQGHLWGVIGVHGGYNVVFFAVEAFFVAPQVMRAEEPAMKDFRNLAFYNFYNENILYYGKRTQDRSSFLLFIVSLDPHNPQGGHFEVPLWEFGLPDNGSLKVEDLTDGRQFVWQGKVQHWWIAPSQRPYAVLRISA